MYMETTKDQLAVYNFYKSNALLVYGIWLLVGPIY